MALRTSWKGFIKLNLVTLPVKAFTAHASSNEIKLNQLHKDCNARVKYKKFCPEHGELVQDDIVSGYEYSKDQYVIIELDELDKLRTENDKAISIQGFIPPNSLDVMYHTGKTYYLTPDGPVGQKPYALLREAMLDSKVEAIAKIILTKKEHIVLLRIIDNLIVMTVLNQEKLIKGIDLFKGEVNEEEVVEEELKLTKMLIAATTLKEFNYGDFKDIYTEKLTTLIQKKIDGEEIVQAVDNEKPKIINLMDALKRSVAEAQGIELSDDQSAEELDTKTKLAPSAIGDQAETKSKKTKKAPKAKKIKKVG